MTTAYDWAPGSNPCPVTHASEKPFEDFLIEQGYSFLKEPVRFNFGPTGGRKTPEAVEPDYQILLTPDGVEHERLFIEITEADRYLSRRDLPAATVVKNLKRAASGKPFIPGDDYLIRKRIRMLRAEQMYSVIIIVLNFAEQQEVFADPHLLTRLIDFRLRA